MRRISKNNIKWLISFILIVMLTVAVVFAFVKISKNETVKNIEGNTFNYELGLLNGSGSFVEDNSSICLKNYYLVDGLTCDIEEDSDITYKIFFFDEEKTFISSTADLSADYDGTDIPENAKYFKIEITPIEDEEITFFEINNYASQLDVSINK